MLWTEIAYNSGAFQNTIKQMWKLKHGVDIKEIGKNIYTGKKRTECLKGSPSGLTKGLYQLMFSGNDWG